ncbi:putative ribosomal protein L18 [Lupinus albus]|uniref:Putative ribosomal protein L18 n=1 Tax=Lupinus albus TaxID=3870 RepID=A0A6A4R261_LUPAL|nr:putative ribosomal protein L18 [Lupinus albus]
MRLKTEEPGARSGVHIDVEKEIKKKGFENQERIWAVINALRNKGVKVVTEDEGHNHTKVHNLRT